MSRTVAVGWTWLGSPPQALPLLCSQRWWEWAAASRPGGEAASARALLLCPALATGALAFLQVALGGPERFPLPSDRGSRSSTCRCRTTCASWRAPSSWAPPSCCRTCRRSSTPPWPPFSTSPSPKWVSAGLSPWPEPRCGRGSGPSFWRGHERKAAPWAWACLGGGWPCLTPAPPPPPPGRWAPADPAGGQGGGVPPGVPLLPHHQAAQPPLHPGDLLPDHHCQLCGEGTGRSRSPGSALCSVGFCCVAQHCSKRSKRLPKMEESKNNQLIANVTLHIAKER